MMDENDLRAYFQKVLHKNKRKLMPQTTYQPYSKYLKTDITSWVGSNLSALLV